MKIAMVYPDQHRWPKYKWVDKALRNIGHQTVWVQSPSELLAADAHCDLCIFAQHDAGIGMPNVVGLAARKKSPWVQWWFDPIFVYHDKPLKDQDTIRESERFFRSFDIVFVKERSMLGDYSEIGINAKYLDQGCPSWLESCGRYIAPKYDVVIIGRRDRFYRQRTLDVLYLANKGFGVVWYGDGEVGQHPNVTPLPWIRSEDIPLALSDAAVCLCIDMHSNVEGYWSDRHWLCCGSGAACIRPVTAGLEGDYFETYSSQEELASKVEALCRDFDRRTEIGVHARREVMAKHTIEDRCRELLEACGGLVEQGKRLVA